MHRPRLPSLLRVSQRRTFIDRKAFQLPPMPKAPPIRQRLKPLIPFFITWTVITSLAVHLLQERKRGDSIIGRAHAKESVLETLIARFVGGEVVPDSEIRRELEMVGLREKPGDLEVHEARKIGWTEMMLGRKREVTEAEAEEEWKKIVKDVSSTEEAAENPEALPVRGPAPRVGVVKRAESDKAFL